METFNGKTWRSCSEQRNRQLLQHENPSTIILSAEFTYEITERGKSCMKAIASVQQCKQYPVLLARLCVMTAPESGEPHRRGYF